MFAVIETGGKQYKVEEGDTIFVEKINAEEGSEISLDKVLAVSAQDSDVKFGAPYVEGSSVRATVVKQGKGNKHKAKKGYRKRQGHRQLYTKLTINKIEA